MVILNSEKEYPGFFESMTMLTKIAFALFIFAKIFGFAAMLLMFASRTIAGILLVTAIVCVFASVFCSIKDMLTSKDGKDAYDKAKAEYERLHKIHGDKSE